MIERYLGKGAALAAVVAGAALLVPADATAQTDLAQNAALRYWQAFSIISDETRVLVGNAANRASDPSMHLSDQEVLAMERSQDTIEMLLQGSAIEKCEFGIDHTAGPHAVLPHLGPMRAGARLLLVSARLKVEDGDIDDAVERASAAFRLSEHVASGRYLISSLVSLSMFSSSVAFIEYMDEQGLLSRDHRVTLLKALDRFEKNDPFSIRSSMLFEHKAMVAWARKQIDLGFGSRAFEGLVSADGVDIQEPWAQAGASKMHAYLDLYVAGGAQSLAAWDAPDSEDRLAAIDAEIATGAFGPMAKSLSPDLSKIKQKSIDASNLYEGVRARLEE